MCRIQYQSKIKKKKKNETKWRRSHMQLKGRQRREKKTETAQIELYVIPTRKKQFNVNGSIHQLNTNDERKIAWESEQKIGQ